MCHAGNADELFEILGDKLWPVVGNNPWAGIGEFLFASLQYDFNICFGHLLPDLPVNYVTTASVQKAAQVIEGTADVYVGHIHMPMFMRFERLHEAGAFEAFLLIPFL